MSWGTGPREEPLLLWQRGGRVWRTASAKVRSKPDAGSAVGDTEPALTDQVVAERLTIVALLDSNRVAGVQRPR
jgi:hypothetical protein